MTMKRNDDAVSPVIGVILMVAITVILAAIIAAFVFGMVGGSSTTKVVGNTLATDGDKNVTVTWQGGADLGAITGLVATFDGANSTNATGKTSPVLAAAPKVGEQWNFKNTGPVAGKRFVLVANFTDGSQQIINDRTF